MTQFGQSDDRERADVRTAWENPEGVDGKTGSTDSGIGAIRGTLGMVRGAWVRLGAGFRFRIRQRPIQGARTGTD